MVDEHLVYKEFIHSIALKLGLLMDILQNFIDGSYQDPINKNYLDNIEPATGLVYGQIPNSCQADVELAVNAAEKALPQWRAMPLEQRADILLAIAQGIESKLDELALAESIDNGKPISLAKAVDIPRAASNFNFLLMLALNLLVSHMQWQAVQLTTLCDKLLALLVVFRHGIYRYIYLLGK